MRIARLILLSVAICVLGTSSAFAETIATQDYWVLTDGYNGDFTNNGQITVSYGPYGNYITGDVYDVDWPGTTGTTDQFFTYDAGRLIYHGARYVDSYGEWLYVPDTAQEFLPAVVEPGKSYTCAWSRKEYKNGVHVGIGSDIYSITVTGPFTTTVPAGAYTTYKFDLSNTWQTSDGITGTANYTYYVSKDIGWVKVMRDNITYELADHARPPSAPQLSIATSDVTLSFSWTHLTSADGYTLFYAPYPSASYIGSIDIGTQTGGSFVLWNGAAFYLAVKAHNSYGSSGYSNIEHFAIDICDPLPTVATGSTVSVTSSSATLNGTVNPNGSDTTYYFQYGTSTSYGSNTASTTAGSGNGDVSASASLTGLGSSTTYHYRLVATNSGGTSYGADKLFTTGSSSSTYTKLDASGNALSVSATSWSMVKDNRTGLIWEVKTDDGSIHDRDDKYSWQDTQDVFIASLNSAGFGGYVEWRLPTIRELAYIVDYGKCGPAIDIDYFPNTESSYYWSSTDKADNTGYIWTVHFFDGYGSYYFKSKTYYVRAVYGGQQSSCDLVDNGNGTVTDTSTGLVWQQATAPGTYTWGEAIIYCDDLIIDGYKDWRLPTIRELGSIVDYVRSNPAINTSFLPDTKSSDYWSFSTSACDRNCAWTLYFYQGYGNSSPKTYSYYVRAVRGAQ